MGEDKNQQIAKKIEAARKVAEELLKRPIAYQPAVAKAFGSVKLAIFWSQLYYWRDRTTDPGGWIYKTQEEIYDETGLGRKEQETARALARELGVIEEKRAGSPPKMHFRIDMDASLRAMSKFVSREPSVKEFRWEDTLASMKESERAEINIIAHFFEQKKIRFDNYGEYQVALKRWLRPAKDLVPFSDDKIEKATREAEREYPGSWTLETIAKLLTKKNF